MVGRKSVGCSDFFAPLRGLLASLLVFMPVTTSSAQTSSIGATLEGTVTDISGGGIPGAQIHLRQAETNQTRAITADDQGFFRASNLPVGTYELHVEERGFAPYSHTGIRLVVGTTVRLEIVLELQTATTQVTVSAQPPPIDPTQTSITSTVERERIEELPVRSRNALDFVLLAPGVGSSPQQPGGSPNTALADSGFTFGGLRARSNSVSIDGLDNNDEYTGANRTELSPEIVREFQVVNNGLAAEFGGASGGSVNVVTRTGTNLYHGDFFFFIQDGALNAHDPFETGRGKPEFRRFRIGSSMGGPVVKDRTFYYLAAEQEHSRGQSGSEIDPAVASAINGFLASGAFPRLATRQITKGFFPVTRAETEASGKLNHQVNARNSLMLRYAFTNNREASGAFGTSGITDASARGSSFVEDHALVGSFASVFGSKALGDLRFQLATRRVALRSNDGFGPGIAIVGLADFGRPYEGNSRRRENHYQASYTYSLAEGKQLWKAGATVNRVRLNATTPDGFGGLYLFASLADFFAGRPDTFRQVFGNPRTNFAVTSFGAFLQDHWTPASRWTLDLGIRYDVERLPRGFNEDVNNVAPRIGLAYSPSAKWVLRAGYGIFFDRYVLANLNRAILRNGTQAFEQVENDGTAAASLQTGGGGPLPAPVPGMAPSIYRSDPRLATTYSQQSSLAVERLLTPNLTASVNYLFVRGAKLFRTRNINLLPPVVLTLQNAASLGIPNPTLQQIGRKVFARGRANPQFNDIDQLEDSASSTHHGLTISIHRRMANELEFVGAYTLSKTFDDASDFDEQPQNPFDIRPERALSRQHLQQRFVFSALWALPIGVPDRAKGKPANSSRGLKRTFTHIEVAPIVTVGSGRPINPLVGLNSDRSDAFPLAARPLGLGRNSLRTPGLATVDLRALKYFPFGQHTRLDFAVESFNLFNRANVSRINPFFGPGASPLAGFGRPMEGVSPRQVQFSVDLEF